MCDSNSNISMVPRWADRNGTTALDLLLEYLKGLPADQRGPEAMRLSSKLLEFAAFEMAGSLTSDRIGALIECAAQLENPEHVGCTVTSAARPKLKSNTH